MKGIFQVHEICEAIILARCDHHWLLMKQIKSVTLFTMFSVPPLRHGYLQGNFHLMDKILDDSALKTFANFKKIFYTYGGMLEKIQRKTEKCLPAFCPSSVCVL